MINKILSSNKIFDSTEKIRSVLGSGPLIIFGAGNIGREVLASLRSHGFNPIIFAVDKKPSESVVVDGVQVLSLDDALKSIDKNPIIVCSIYSPGHKFVATKERLLSACPSAEIYSFLTVLLAIEEKKFKKYFFIHPDFERDNFEKYEEIYNKLEDKKSRETLASHLRLRLLHDFSIEAAPRTCCPLPNILSHNGNLSYVDGGAYDGDTIIDFISSRGEFSQIWGIEPDSYNRVRMENRLSMLYPGSILSKISIVPKVLWRSTDGIGFNESGNMGSSISPNSSSRYDSISIDNLLSGTDSNTLIKLDVEGAEMDVLAGAMKTTHRLRPTWAISAYHNPNDLVDIFSWLERTKQGYKYGLRCYGGDGSDLMIYAW